MSSPQNPNQIDLVAKYAGRIFILNEIAEFLTLLKRLGIYKAMTDLLTEIVAAKDKPNPPIHEIAGRILLHSKFPNGIVNGEAVSEGENMLLGTFGMKVLQDLIRDHSGTQRSVVQIIRSEMVAICEARGWSQEEMLPLIESLKRYNDSIADLSDGEDIVLPDANLSDQVTKQEPYLSWAKPKPKLEQLAMIIHAEKKWIDSQREWIAFLDPNVITIVPVHCNKSFKEHLTLLIHCLVKTDWIANNVREAHWAIAGKTLLDKNGKPIHSNFRVFPRRLLNDKAKKQHIIREVADVLKRIGHPLEIITEYLIDD